MLLSLVGVLLGGLAAGQGVKRLGGPPLLGMMLVGIASQGWLSADLIQGFAGIRTAAVMIILLKAGLGLDRQKLQAQGSVTLRLGVLPAACEALLVMGLAMGLFQFSPATGLLLGCVLAAESPAVIVPGMLRLKSLGWGVAKGIPDAIMTGSALSDVLLLLVFSVLLDFLAAGTGISPWWIPIQVMIQVGLGVVLGYGLAVVLILILSRLAWTETTVQEVILLAAVALAVVVLGEHLPYSGYVAVMAMGYGLVDRDPPLARRLRQGVDSLWIVFEILLFVLLGATLPLQVLGEVAVPGTLLLLLSTVLGRGLGWALSTWGSNWTLGERLFLLAGNSAKATVQAAIGGIPLSLGLAGGEEILALAGLAILLTAPLGAWAIPTFAPRLLVRGEIDPTQVSVSGTPTFLAAVDTGKESEGVLKKAADLARRSQGRLVILHVGTAMPEQQSTWQALVRDIPHEVVIRPGPVPETILRVAEDYQVSDILMGKRENHPSLLGSVSESVLSSSSIPVIIVTNSSASAPGLS